MLLIPSVVDIHNPTMSTASLRPLLLAATVWCAGPPLRARQAPSTTDPISTYLRRAFHAVAKDIVAAAELMPEADYNFRPAGVVTIDWCHAASVHIVLLPSVVPPPACEVLQNWRGRALRSEE